MISRIPRALCLQIVLGIFLALVFGCGRGGPDPDIPLIGGYVLASYESTDESGYFIAKGNQVIVSSSVLEVGIADDRIVGRVADADVLAMARIKDGYFVLDVVTGQLTEGLSRDGLIEMLGGDTAPDLCQPRQWKR